MHDLTNNQPLHPVLSPGDLQSLRAAVLLLENPGFVARLANWVGMPVEQLFRRLPARAGAMVQSAVSKALHKCLDVALHNMQRGSVWSQSERAMKLTVAATGAAGGAFGIVALPVELPVTTTVMLRSIAEIARAEGEDFRDPAAGLACLEVFALGGKSRNDDGSDAGYYGIRAALAVEVNAALRFMASQQGKRAAAPPLIRVIETIAARFGVVVSDKVAAGAVPVIGAIGGATVNALFMNHFQDMAHGHFTVRRLERRYGPEAVRRAYETIARQTG